MGDIGLGFVAGFGVLSVGDSLFIEEFAEAGVSGAADWELRAAVEHGYMAVFAVRLDAGDAFEIDDVRAMNAEEAGRVEGGFEAGNCLLLEVLFTFGAERDVIVLRFSVVELGDCDDEDASPVANRDAIEILRRWTRGGGKFRG